MSEQQQSGGLSEGLPEMKTKLTASDMGVRPPRLDDKCLDDKGNPDPQKREVLDALIKKWAFAYRISGRVTSVKGVKGKGDQDGIRFIGAFRAQLAPHLKSLWFAGGRCHLPRAGEESLHTAFVMAVEEAAKESADVPPEKAIHPSVVFMFDIGVKPPHPDKPSITGYEWTVRPVVDFALAHDPLLEMFRNAPPPLALASPVAPSTVPASTVVNGAASAGETVSAKTAQGRAGVPGSGATRP